MTRHEKSPSDMTDEELMDEHGDLRRHEDADNLTDEQNRRLINVQREMLERMSPGIDTGEGDDE